MSDSYYICLLGFASESENRIKKLLEEENIIWVPPNFQGLSGVIVNSVFLGTRQIKKYLARITAQIVCAYNNDDSKRLAQEEGYLGIDLRAPELDFKRWSNYLFKREDKPRSPTVGLREGLEETFVDAAGGGTNPAGSRIIRLLEHIAEQPGKVLRLEYQEKITWIRATDSMAFINYPRETIAGVEKWSCREVAEGDISEQARPLKLEVWLFEAIWQSDFQPQEIEDDVYYYLTSWPQPLGRKGRSEALRLGSLTRGTPTTVEELQDKTNYPEMVIKRFLFAALKSGQLAISQDAPPSKKKAYDDSEEAEEKRGLLRRLRDKFGM